jgi:general secretion pathway protein I
MTTRAGERGSALVEAMIGAAIVAITLASMYVAITQSAAGNRMAEDRRMAMMIARSQMAAVGSIIPAAPGITEGMNGDFYWRVDIEPYAAAPEPGTAGRLCVVTVVVGDQHRRPLANLVSLTLVRST